MKKKDFIEKLSQQIKRSKTETNAILDEISHLITRTLKSGDEVGLPIGKFQLKKRAARAGVNPSTGERIQVKAKVVPAFRASKQFKLAVLE